MKTRNCLLLMVIGVSSLVCGMAQADVLNATARDANEDDNHFLFGTTVSVPIGISGDYAGITSHVAAVDNPNQTDDFIGTTAMILAGTNTSPNATTVSFAWRNRTALERNGMAFSSMPRSGMDQYYMVGGGSNTGVALAYDAYDVLSDVVNIEGVEGVYVLQMGYDENLIFNGHHPEMTVAKLEPYCQETGRLFLGWLETGGLGKDVPDSEIGVPQLKDYDEWCNAVVGNSVVGGNAVANYPGSWQAFLLDYPGAKDNLADYLGSWGVDIDQNLVWSVLDHNSQFVVAPEPATLGLLALGGLTLMLRRKRK